MPRNYLTLLRSASVLLSGIGALAVANLMLHFGGDSIYAHYALLTGISAMLPFIDLGIGYKVNSVILDYHADAKTNISKELSLCFTLLVTISFIFSLILFILFMSGQFAFFVLLGLQKSDSLLLLIIMLLTFLNIPLSMGSRILLADGKVVRPLIYSILGTLLSIASLSLLLVLPKNQFVYLSIVPMLVMNFSNFGLLRYVQKKKRFVFSIDFNLLQGNIYEILKYGLQASLLISFLPIALQIPKYLLGSKNLTTEIAQYSLFLLFLQPLVAVSSFTIFSDLPKIRKTQNLTTQGIAIVKTLAYSVSVGFISTSALIVISLSNLWLPFRLPNKDLIIFLLALVPLITVKQIFISLFTKPKNMIYLIATYLTSSFIALAFFIVFGNFSAKSAISLFLLTDAFFSLVFSLFFLKRHLLILRQVT